MKLLLSWKNGLKPFVVAVQHGDVKGLIAAARKNSTAAEKLGLRAIVLMMAHPCDCNRRRLWDISQSWQGISLRRLMRNFTRRQRLADKRQHVRRCYKSAQRVAPDVLSA